VVGVAVKVLPNCGLRIEFYSRLCLIMLVVVFFFGFSWAIWYVSYARLKDKLSLLRGERAEELSQLDQKIKQLESSHWSTDTDLRREVAQLTRHVQELQF